MWWGIGALCVALAWTLEKRRNEKIANELIAHVMGDIVKDIGHVIDYHPTGDQDNPSIEFQHAHCICGETSLMYRTDDPTAERLMEQWADNHIDTLMESSGR
jgi:hypothetical protein